MYLKCINVGSGKNDGAQSIVASNPPSLLILTNFEVGLVIILGFNPHFFHSDINQIAI